MPIEIDKHVNRASPPARSHKHGPRRLIKRRSLAADLSDTAGLKLRRGGLEKFLTNAPSTVPRKNVQIVKVTKPLELVDRYVLFTGGNDKADDGARGQSRVIGGVNSNEHNAVWVGGTLRQPACIAIKHIRQCREARGVVTLMRSNKIRDHGKDGGYISEGCGADEHYEMAA